MNYHRSGRPHLLHQTTKAATVEKWQLDGETIKIWFWNTHGSEALEIFLTEEAATAGAGNGIPLASGATDDFEMEIIEFWTLSTNASKLRVLYTTRP
jgi:hypothetical protein